MRLTRLVRPWVPALGQAEHFYMALIALGIGLLGGLGAVLFREFIGLMQKLSWGTGDVTLAYLRSLPWYWKVFTPAVGGFLVGIIGYRFARETKGHGVPEVMEAVALRGGRIRPRVVLGKLLASGICIASGGSVGREGPIVQIGSALGSTIGQWLGMGERRLRTLVGCGAAAGIAGTFNAPVAGALFAVEIILGDFGVAQFSPIVISSVAATVVSHHFLGDTPAFIVPEYSLVSAPELFAYVVLGLLAGLVAVLFLKTLYGMEDLFRKLQWRLPLKAALGGGLVGLIGLHFPQVFGVGYEAIDEALAGDLLWHTLLVLAAVKIVAVGLTLGSGGSGGVFAPSLFIGAMTGGTVGAVVHSIWPESTAHPGAYALVGMGAVVAAGTHAPITAIVILFELTGDYKIILPLMISCIIATLLSMQIHKPNLYTMKLLRRGIDLRVGQTISVLRHLRARDLMRSQFTSVSPEEPLMGVVSRLVENPGCSVFVCGEVGELEGVITTNEMRPHMRHVASSAAELTARDMMLRDDFPILEPGEFLDEVVQRLGNYRFEAPVLDHGRLVGVVRPEDVEARYNAEVFKRDMASSMTVAAGSGLRAQAIPGVRGMSMAEVAAPPDFVGRTLAELHMRREYDVTVLLVKRRSGKEAELVNQLPDARYVLRPGDVMLVMGPEEKVEALEHHARGGEGRRKGWGLSSRLGREDAGSGD